MKKKTFQLLLKKNQGFAMIEALVAILILSIGVLGMVGMQSAAIRYEQNSWARSAVSMMGGEIADRIRANAGTANNTAYSYTNNYVDERTLIDEGSAFTLTVDCTSTVCTPDQLAIFDLIRWRDSLNRLAPGAVGLVSGSRAQSYVVTIAWFDKTYLKDGVGGLDTAATCEANLLLAAARNCCPAALSSPAGVRCVNFAVVP